MKTVAIIVAGGSGTRFGAELPKQFLELGGMPILMRTIRAFWDSENCPVDVIVTLPSAQIDLWQQLCRQYGFSVPHRVVLGGETRWHSVKNALDSMGDVNEVDIIAVHDGVRPMVTADVICRTIEAARRGGAAIPVHSTTRCGRLWVKQVTHLIVRHCARCRRHRPLMPVCCSTHTPCPISRHSPMMPRLSSNSTDPLPWSRVTRII